jgi:AcrR family transcriptional regulator
MSSLTEQRRDATRAEILRAAELLFIEDGVKDTSLAEIARAVGLKRAALYYYFPSRDAVVAAVVESIVRRMRLDVDEPASVDQVVADFIEQFLGAFMSESSDVRFLLTALLEQLDDEAETQLVRMSLMRFRDDLAVVLDRGKKRGEVLEGVDSIAACDQLAAGLLGIELMSIVNPALDHSLAADRLRANFLADVLAPDDPKENP